MKNIASRPRVGLVGYGLAGRVFHAQLLKAAGFELAAIVTTNEERKAQASSDFPQARIRPTFSEILDDDLDLIVIASANSVHADQAIQALLAGIPAVVDKPMALNLAETQRIAEVTQATGIPVSVFYNRLWDSDTLTIKKALLENVLGNVFRMDSRFERFRPTPNPSSWRERDNFEAGGGTLLDLQSHLVSIALHLFGPAQLVHSSVRSIRGHADDDVVLVLKHDSGMDSYLSASAIVGSPGPRVRLMGDKGALVIPELDPQEALLRQGIIPSDGVWQVPTSSEALLYRGEDVVVYPSVDGNYPHFYDAVRAALKGEGPWPTSVHQALAVAIILEEARKVSIHS